MIAASFQSSAVPRQWAAQPRKHSGLYRWATRPVEREREFKWERALAGFKRLSIPSGESPDGTGQWPVPPKKATEY